MRWVYLLVTLAAAAAVWAVLNERLEAPAAESVAPADALPRYALANAEWLRLDARGEPELRVRTESIDYYADDSAQMGMLTLDALGGTESPWTLTAPRGRMPAHERRVLLEGGVLAQGRYADEPVQFTTEALWVDLLRRELRTDAAVVLYSEFRRASARGLRADFSGENVQLLNDVQVEYVPGD